MLEMTDAQVMAQAIIQAPTKTAKAVMQAIAVAGSYTDTRPRSEAFNTGPR